MISKMELSKPSKEKYISKQNGPPELAYVRLLEDQSDKFLPMTKTIRKKKTSASRSHLITNMENFRLDL